ncbi:hypothetical protein RJ639_042772 [Escallonia herrerae]|uniref:Gnk2-homologous domain-containing protein n=1 Tax=Escallonia herrerae TaxID=1293975 RepID=A0AA88WMJ3_9ASTE|nr:hypothetical protein RJ639_042772 [Escallonia herrerae]
MQTAINTRQSSRQRGPPRNPFASDFVGKDWQTIHQSSVGKGQETGHTGMKIALGLEHFSDVGDLRPGNLPVSCMQERRIVDSSSDSDKEEVMQRSEKISMENNKQDLEAINVPLEEENQEQTSTITISNRGIEIMDSPRLCICFLFILNFLVSLTTPQSKFRFNCCSDTGNYTSNSTYARNLNALLSSIPASSDLNSDGFFNSFIGKNPNQVYAIGLCRGDLAVASCRSCLNDTFHPNPSMS